MADAKELASRQVFSLGITPSDGSLWTNRDVKYEWAIGGQPFLSMATDEFQMLRGFVQVRKDQLDTQQDPGEQSLTGWWLRSQRDFSAGAGLNFFEPGHNHTAPTDERIMRQYKSSFGVDPWTPGQVSLLRKMFLSAWTSGTKCYVATAGNYAAVSAASLYVAGVSTTGTSTVVSPGTVSAQPDWLVSSGTTVFAFSTGGIDKFNIDSNTVSNIYTTGGVSGRGWWMKGNLWASIGSSIYQLSESPASSALPSAVPITTTPSGWVWTSACETPSAMLFAGYSGSKSVIYQLTQKVDITSAGSTTISYSATTVAELPYGETVLSLYNYLGSYVAIGTNKGLRIGIVSDQGTISYGPLTYSGSAVEHMMGRDRFIFAGVSNGVPDETSVLKSGLIRVDLSNPDDSGRYAWAYDLSTGVTGTILGVANIGTSSQIAIAVYGSGVYYEHATELVATGRLESAQVRYSTLEPKTFQLATVRSDSTNGSISVSSVGSLGSITNLYTLSNTSSSAEIAMFPRTPTESMGLRFDLRRSATNAAAGPILRGWQFKALPAVTRKQQWQLPLVCFDQEQDRFGNRAGFTGAAFSRYQALRSALITGTPVVLQDLVNNEQYTVLVEDVRMVQTTPPRGASGFGGVLVVEAREL